MTLLIIYNWHIVPQTFLKLNAYKKFKQTCSLLKSSKHFTFLCKSLHNNNLFCQALGYLPFTVSSYLNRPFLSRFLSQDAPLPLCLSSRKFTVPTGRPHLPKTNQMLLYDSFFMDNLDNMTYT